MWTDHLRAAGLLAGVAGAIALFVWLCAITQGMFALGVVAGAVVVALYMWALSEVRYYRRRAARRQADNGIWSD